MAVALDDPRHRPPRAGSDPSARGRLATVPDRVPVRRARRVRALHRRRRLTVLAAVLVALSVTFAMLYAAQRATASDAGADVRADAPARPAPAAPGPADRVVVIAAGESVWEAVAPHVPVGMSIHDWVDRVVRHNAVDPAAVPAGTLLRLPSR